MASFDKDQKYMENVYKRKEKMQMFPEKGNFTRKLVLFDKVAGMWTQAPIGLGIECLADLASETV